MASTCGPEAEFDDPRRKELLQRLNDMLPTDTLPPTVLACLWLSDIDKLEELVAIQKAQANPTFLHAALLGAESARLVPIWTQRKRPGSSTSTPQRPSTPLQAPSTPPQLPSAQSSRGKKRYSGGQLVIRRSRMQADQCRQRDQKKCILTKAGEPIEVAHIYPFSMQCEDNTTRPPLPSFWGTLRLFWSNERIDAWYNAIFSNPAKTEICQNLVCLAPNAHAYWERGYFALKPIRISVDRKRLDVQFFWLSLSQYSSQVNILQAPSLSAPDHGPNLTRLFNNETITQICSGDEISLETDDPVLRPLPDLRLLEMQWFLHRVTAMSGAAGPQDNFSDWDSDDDVTVAFQGRRNIFVEDDWDMDIEESPSAEHLQVGSSYTQHFGARNFNPMVTLRGGGGGSEEGEGEGGGK